MWKKNRKLIPYSILYFVLFGFGISLQLKAAIGQSVLNAMAVTAAFVLPLKVGTLLNIINTLFFITYLLFRHTRLNYKDGIQIIATILNGIIINFFLYNILSGFTVSYYGYRVLLYFTGLIIASISLGAILAIGIIKFPLESLCLTICERTRYSLTVIRMSFDVIFLVVTLIMTFLARTPLQIREGTLISVLLLSTLLGICYDFFKKYWKMEESLHVSDIPNRH